MAAAHWVTLSANESLSAWMKAFPRRRMVPAFRPMLGAYVTRAQSVSAPHFDGSSPRDGQHPRLAIQAPGCSALAKNSCSPLILYPEIAFWPSGEIIQS